MAISPPASAGSTMNSFILPMWPMRNSGRRSSRGRRRAKGDSAGRRAHHVVAVEALRHADRPHRIGVPLGAFAHSLSPQAATARRAASASRRWRANTLSSPSSSSMSTDARKPRSIVVAGV